MGKLKKYISVTEAVLMQMVILATGVRPELELAKNGLTVISEDGLFLRKNGNFC